MPRPPTLSSFRCPLCRVPSNPSTCLTHPAVGLVCDDCYSLLTEDDPALTLTPRLPLISNFTDLNLSPHADSLLSPSTPT